jgi:serine/threonine protein phosphatase PrpC
MSVPTLTSRVVPASADEDRLGNRSVDGAELIVLADGAGGTTGGRQAADRIVGYRFGSLRGPLDCVEDLRRLDDELASDPSCGESTAVLLVVLDGKVFGASVGDSGAWALTVDGVLDVTERQRRKPLLGSGEAEPVGFGPLLFNDRVLVASDGLLKYAARERIRRSTFIEDIDAAADELVAAARLPSGLLQDDLSLVIVQPPRLTSRISR